MGKGRGGDSSSDSLEAPPPYTSSAQLRTGSSGPLQGHGPASGNSWEFFNKAGGGVTV